MKQEVDIGKSVEDQLQQCSAIQGGDVGAGDNVKHAHAHTFSG